MQTKERGKICLNGEGQYVTQDIGRDKVQKMLHIQLEQIKEDLTLLNELGFKYLRMYDPIRYAEETCKVIRDCGFDMQLMLGPGLISEVNNPGCPWNKTNY